MMLRSSPLTSHAVGGVTELYRQRLHLFMSSMAVLCKNRLIDA